MMGMYVYCELVRDIDGFPQVDMLTNKLLKEILAVHDYYEVTHTPGLFTHKTRPIWFALTVDNFGVKNIGRENAEHLVSVFKQHYVQDGRRLERGTVLWGHHQMELRKRIRGYFHA